MLRAEVNSQGLALGTSCFEDECRGAQNLPQAKIRGLKEQTLLRGCTRAQDRLSFKLRGSREDHHERMMLLKFDHGNRDDNDDDDDDGGAHGAHGKMMVA